VGSAMGSLVGRIPSAAMEQLVSKLTAQQRKAVGL